MHNQHDPSQENKWLLFLITLAALVNLSGLFIPLIDPDAGVYASVSKQMVSTGNWLELFHKGEDWLDKPHFQFWITAAFFKLFGIHDWSYKLPGILFVFIGALYTYLFARKYYNKRTALWSVFILLTAEHIIISNNDVRAEPFLTGLIIASVYHFSNSFSKDSWIHLLIACFFTACALMTKGPYTLIPIVSAIAGELIMKKNWRQLFHWKWLVAVLLIFIFIIPELYSLWYQFDRHPDKVIFGRTNVSGIKFFLWDSQFGRFTNTGPIKGIGEPTFFIHTLLWAFLPWSVIMYVALFEKLKRLRNNPEFLALFGSLATILVFSMSRFQLPYYTNIIFPFLAVLTASWIEEKRLAYKKSPAVIQNIVSVFLIAGVIVFQFFYSPILITWAVIISFLLALPVLFLPVWLKDRTFISLIRSGMIILAINFYLNTVFYPDLMQYHSGKEAAFYINKNHPNVRGVYFNRYSAALDFYLKEGLVKADPDGIAIDPIAKNGVWYITAEELADLKTKDLPFEIIKELPEYRISMLSLKFLNKKTRNAELRKFYLVRFSK
jgi:4-amino-4-deoxy-L-arabinose transferase-like glycosyltransferase